ncbi:Nuclear movement protein nudC like [Verticillium longisporum]|uniref:Nuclear movement protein nudC like n=1 Tax=Verticillium longisporum TaxID=100787 RepID=A0A8I2ZXU0_VERLO|nr:Nuclear movement protein nudC like [Verticillium longisporum]
MRFREPKTDEEKAAREKQNAEQAALPYTWYQKLEELEVKFDVPINYKPKDLVINFTRTSLKAGIKGETPLIDGNFPHPIRVDESTWGMTVNAAKDAKTVTIQLDKTNKMECDVTEGSTRAMAEKLMWESTLTPEQKQKNKQEENMKRLAELQKQTGLDFSQAEINHG